MFFIQQYIHNRRFSLISEKPKLIMEGDTLCKTILIAGGAGYIGSHVVVELLQAGHRIVVVDNLSNSHANSDEHEDLPPALLRAKQISGSHHLTFFKVDVSNQDRLHSIFEEFKFDVVVDLTGRKAVGESAQFPILYYNCNMKGTMTLLKCMRKHNVCHFIFSSSCTVYGAPNQDQLPIKETDPVGGCHCPYAKCKYFIESLLEDLANGEQDYWHIIVMRYFNPVGAHESGLIGEDPNGEPQNLMPRLAQVAVGRCPSLNIYGEDYDTPDGTPIRDYVHVVDVAEAHQKALDKIESINGIDTFNIGSGQGKSTWDMINAFQKVSVKQIKFIVSPRRPGDVPAIYCDPRKAERELGWKAKRSHEQMCEDLWRFYSKNPNGYQ